MRGAGREEGVDKAPRLLNMFYNLDLPFLGAPPRPGPERQIFLHYFLVVEPHLAVLRANA